LADDESEVEGSPLLFRTRPSIDDQRLKDFYAKSHNKEVIIYSSKEIGGYMVNIAFRGILPRTSSRMRS
jgi:hypothetical protein